MSNAGKMVKVHYTGTLDDGTKFDSSYDRNEPIEFMCMAGQMIPGFDAAVDNMEVGEKKTVHLDPADAYGEYDPDAVYTIPFENIPNAAELPVGQRVTFSTSYGPMPALVVSVDEKNIVLDTNSELAGKPLNFEIELVEVSE